uniref:O-fucosyltransferase family protein n=1 Tax=Lotharella oceanica TaxID=641309 RepID=A0A7S2TQG4_9EUKA|mmetsp:Transcript_24526/g.45871  ORF Transcript_24526/g.45871 Transcript_24526/m.45871 type:complete len:495 (+) Transcript_24526:76-1560(+)
MPRSGGEHELLVTTGANEYIPPRPSLQTRPKSKGAEYCFWAATFLCIFVCAVPVIAGLSSPEPVVRLNKFEEEVTKAELFPPPGTPQVSGPVQTTHRPTEASKEEFAASKGPGREGKDGKPSAAEDEPESTNHGTNFNATYAFCKDIKHKGGRDPPTGCPTDRFVIPVGEGGLNNAILRLWHGIVDANRTRTHTLLLPYLRNHPARFKPAQDLGPSRRIPFSDVFDEDAYCAMLKDLNICYICQHHPPHDDARADLWKEGIPPGLPSDDPDSFKRTKNDITILSSNVWPDQSPEFYRYLRGLVPNALAQNAIKKVRHSIGTRKYVSVHMRIEDDWRAFKRGGFYVPADQIVREIAEQAFFSQMRESSKDKTLPVFIATGAKEEATKAWGAVPGVRVVYNVGHHLKGMNWAARSLVDLEVAKDAEVFIGTAMFSTFSSNIVFFRFEEARCQAVIHGKAMDNVLSYAYHNMEKWGRGKLLECHHLCWGKEKEEPGK